MKRDLGPAPMYVPPSWNQALQDERDGLGAIRFIDGMPHWFAGERQRWIEGDAADEDWDRALAVGAGS